jgi:hypothetical protein
MYAKLKGDKMNISNISKQAVVIATAIAIVGMLLGAF